MICRLECAWDGNKIFVMPDDPRGGVHVSEPYDASACAGSNAMLLDRVRTILNGERKRIQEKLMQRQVK